MIYSHSRLKCFEQCPYKFKLKYIEKIKPKLEQSIESFLGSRVHDTLEKLYNDLKFKKFNSLEELLIHFNDEWKRNWNSEILIVRKDYVPENYRKMGEQFITDYYKRYYPFRDGKIIGLEKRIMINLDSEGKYKLQGFIDRLMTTGDGKYEIHDYKTNADLPLEEYMKEDRQLALYALAVLHGYQDANKIKLIWHFLATDKEIVVEKTKEELDKLRKDTIELIQKIENEREHKTRVSKLCDWCEFREQCPEWSHIVKTENLEPNKFLDEPGIKLVNRYAELQNEKTKHCEKIDKEMDQVKEALIKVSEKENASVINGSDHIAKIWIKECSKLPGKNDPTRDDLEKILKAFGEWNSVAQLDTFKLSRMIDDEQVPPDVMKEIEKFIEKTKVERIYLRKKNEKV
ncbi:MAG: PD-(D/E)XK nuclease family protein [Candidatus Aenigmatarchaeota archaeon]